MCAQLMCYSWATGENLVPLGALHISGLLSLCGRQPPHGPCAGRVLDPELMAVMHVNCHRHWHM